MGRRAMALALMSAISLTVFTMPPVQAASSSSPNLELVASVPYLGGSDLEFMSRMEEVTGYRTEHRWVKHKTVNCSRKVRCRKGQTTKVVKIKPYLESYQVATVTQVERSYLFAGSLRSFAGGRQAGLRIVDITDPSNPRLRSFYSCNSNQLDVQVLNRDDRTYVLLGLDYGSAGNSRCFSDLHIPPSSVGVAVIDVTDVDSPKGAGWIPLPYGAHNLTMHPSGNYLYASDSELTRSEDLGIVTNGRVTVVQIGDFARTMRKDFWLGPGGSAHDITFNTNGTRAYVASLTQTFILNTTDPGSPKLISVIADPSINIHHQADPYTVGGRDYLVVTDELAGAAGNGSCPGGGLHIFDITVDAAPVKVSTFAIPKINSIADTGRLHRCTAHVLRIYPERGILTIAWYEAGTWVVDVSNPLLFKAVGFATPPRTDVWAAKLFGDHIYTNDLSRGIDVFRYTGPVPIVPQAGSAKSSSASASPGISPFLCFLNK